MQSLIWVSASQRRSVDTGNSRKPGTRPQNDQRGSQGHWFYKQLRATTRTTKGEDGGSPGSRSHRRALLEMKGRKARNRNWNWRQLRGSGWVLGRQQRYARDTKRWVFFKQCYTYCSQAQGREGAGAGAEASSVSSCGLENKPHTTWKGRERELLQPEHQVKESGVRVLGAAEGMKYAKFWNNTFLLWIFFLSK